MQLSTGFSNWKDGLAKIRNHARSEHHKEANEALFILPKQTKDIGEQLDPGHASRKPGNQKVFLTILENAKFLARQGLPLRGDGDESNSNFKQPFLLRSEGSVFEEWLSKRTDTYLSNNIQNDLLRLMAKRVLDEISSSIQKSTFFSLMADETTDAANKEQLVIVYRCVDDEFVAHEELVGLRDLKKADAQLIFHELTESMKDLHLDVHRMRGQCYDGASTMSGTKSGVAKLITDIEPSAIYTHCYGHALNLAANDTVKRCDLMKNTLDTAHEICKLVKSSPKRDALLQQIKQDVQADIPGVRVLCPTRWIVRADSMKSILEITFIFWNCGMRHMRKQKTQTQKIVLWV